MTQSGRRALATLGILAVALAAAVGLRAAPAFSLGWYGDGTCDDSEAANPGAPGDCRYEVRETDCGNGIDDDSDERTDALDPDCLDKVCEPQKEACGDGVDQDCDGEDLPCCRWWEVWCQESGGGLSFGGITAERTEVLDLPEGSAARWDIAQTETAFVLSAADRDVWIEGDEDELTWSLVGGPATAESSAQIFPNDFDASVDVANPGDSRFLVRAGESRVFEFLATGQAEVAACVDSRFVLGGIRWGYEATDDTPFELPLGEDAFPMRAFELCPLADRTGWCSDGVDNDGNGLADCDDLSCQNEDGTCGSSGREVCGDGDDNDADGKFDCADAECAGVTVERSGYALGILCEPSGETTCSDGWDNDGDGLTDSYDPNCGGGATEHCFNETDDDADGLADCADPDCAGPQGQEGYECEPSGESICDDGFDNDGDSAVDCDDAACATRCAPGLSVRFVSESSQRENGSDPGDGDRVTFDITFAAAANGQDVYLDGDLGMSPYGGSQLSWWWTDDSSPLASTTVGALTAVGGSAKDSYGNYLIRAGDERVFRLRTFAVATQDNTSVGVRISKISWGFLSGYVMDKLLDPGESLRTELVTGLQVR